MESYLSPILLFLLSHSAVYATEITIGDTKDFYIQSKHSERYIWTVLATTVEKTPIWKKGSDLPLPLEKAEELAHSWTRRQNSAGYIPERPFSIILKQFPAPLSDHYFYKVHFNFSDNQDSFWTVHILLDGTVIEPKKVSQKDAASNPCSGSAELGVRSLKL